MSDHVYVDLSLYNNSVSTTDSQAQPLILNDRRASAYIEKCSDYRCSISRFSLSSQLPLLIPQIKLNQPQYMPDGITLNPQWLDTVYSFTLGLSVNDVMYYSDQTFLNCKVMQNRYIVQPTLGIQDMNSVYDNPYFYIDSIAFFIKYLVNPTLVRAVASLITNYSNLAPSTLPRTPAILSRHNPSDALPTLNSFIASTSASVVVGWSVDTTQLTSPIYYTMAECNYWVDTINSIFYLSWAIQPNIFPSPVPWVQNISAYNAPAVVGSFEVDESYYTVTNGVTYQSVNYINNYWQDLEPDTHILNASIFYNAPLAYNGWNIPTIGCLITYPNMNSDESRDYVEYIDGNTFRLDWVDATNTNNNTTSGFLNNMLCAIVISSEANGLGNLYSQPNTTITSFTIDETHLVIGISPAISQSIPNRWFLTINPLMIQNVNIEASFNGYALLPSPTVLNPINIEWLISGVDGDSGGTLSFINQLTTNETWMPQNVMLPPSPVTTNVYTLSFVGSFFTNSTEVIEAVTSWQILSTQEFNIYEDETGIDNFITGIVNNGSYSTYTFTNQFKSFYQNPTVNNFSLGFTTVNTLSPRIPPPCPITSSDIPYMQHETDGNFQLVYTEPYLIDVLNPDSKANIYMNSSLFYLFNGFNALSFGFTPNAQEDMTNGKNYMLLTDMERQTFTVPALPPFIPAQTLWYITTEYACCPFWTPIQNISFIASTIPISPLFSLPTIILGDTASIITNPSNLATANIITDFDINVTTGLEAKSIIQYTPSGEYKWIDLQGGDKPLSELSFYVCWKDKLSGGYHRFMLSSGGSASVRLLFRKKSYYVGDNLYNVGNLTQDTDKIEITRPQVGGLHNKYYY